MNNQTVITAEEINKNNCDAIIEEINDAIKADVDCIASNQMMDEIRFYIWEDKRQLSDINHLEGDTKELVELAKEQGIDEKKIFEALKEYSTVELHGVRVPDRNYLLSWNLGEREVRIDGLKEKLAALNPEEYNYVTKKLKGYIGDNPTDYVYHNMDHTVYYLRPDLDAIKKELGIF